jgi:hypothetical protein
MRTTLTLDDDVAMLLKKRADESGHSFREVVNRALRVGLLGDRPSGDAPNIPQPHSMGGARVDLEQALSLSESLNDDALVAQLRG